MESKKEKEIKGMTLNQLFNLKNELDTELIGRCYGLSDTSVLIKEKENKEKVLIVTIIGQKDLITNDMLINYYLIQIRGNRNYEYIKDSYKNNGVTASKQYIIK